MTSSEYARQIHASNSASYWLKNAVEAAEFRDALDALRDAELLLQFCRKRADEALGKAQS